MNCRSLGTSLENPQASDWHIESDNIDYQALLGDVVARADSPERAARSLIEKLELYRTRLLSIANPQSAQAQRAHVLAAAQAMRIPNR